MENMNGFSGINYWKQVDLVIYCKNETCIDEALFERYGMLFRKLIITAPKARPADVPKEYGWFNHSGIETRAEVWNIMLNRSSAEWVLFLNQDERLQLENLPPLNELSPKIWAPAIVMTQVDDRLRQFYEMRLVPAGAGHVFSGRNLTDCTRFIVDNEHALYEHPLIIEGDSDPYDEIIIDDELSIRDFAPKLYLIEGDRLFRARKYIHAAAQYRQILKMKHLLPYDRLAGINGLASCLAEQYKWEQAITLADRSVEAEAIQSVPYLIKFKVFQLNKQWNEAFEALNLYYEKKFYEHIHLYSRANFDVSLNPEQVLITLSDLALKAGDKEKSSDFLEELYSLKSGMLEESFIHQLLMLSLELSDYQKSVFFFRRMFEGLFPGSLTDTHRTSLNDYMDMFMKKGWYGFVCEIYTELYHTYPEDDEYRRRLIVTLMKTDNVEKARDLAIKVA